MGLAELAGLTVVAAAVTDMWETARRGFARLLGRGDRKREQLADERLQKTREQLTGAEGATLEKVRAELEQRWTARLADLLEEDPGVEADLRALVEEIRAALPPGAVSAADHAIVAGGDVNITASGSGVATGTIHASGGGVAAAVVHGNVTPANPTDPGPATS
jgi:hypothetical protein